MGIRKNTTVQLFALTDERSETGQPVGTWRKYTDVMGSVSALRGNAYYSAQQTANEVLLELYIWYRDDVKAGHRARVLDEVYEIVGRPDNIHLKNRELLLRLRAVE